MLNMAACNGHALDEYKLTTTIETEWKQKRCLKKQTQYGTHKIFTRKQTLFEVQRENTV